MSFKELLALFIVFAISIDMTVSAKIHKGKPIFRSFHKIKSKVDITDRRHYPCAEGEDPCIDDVVNFSAIRHYGHERASLQFQKDLESGIEIKTFLDMSEIETCHSSAEDVIRAIRIFNTMEKHFKHIHLEHDKNKYQATLRHAFRQVFDRQIIHSHNTILEELETLATVTTDNQDQISVIQCYFDQQATATTSHASACFNTTAFVLEKFDNLYHTLWALDIIKNKGNESEFLAEDKAKIESARNSLR